MKRETILRAAVAALFVCGLLVMAGSALADDAIRPLTHPTWVADSPNAGVWIPTWTQSSDTTGLTTIKGIRAIECRADTETKFVAYWYKRGPGVDKVKWPIWGVAEGDTCWTVPAGETRTYTFEKPWVQFIIVTSGDADFSGE